MKSLEALVAAQQKRYDALQATLRTSQARWERGIVSLQLRLDGNEGSGVPVRFEAKQSGCPGGHKSCGRGVEIRQ